jgi:hypothetical protein
MQTPALRNGQAPINHWSLPGINPARQCRIDKVRTVFIDFPDKNWLRSVIQMRTKNYACLDDYSSMVLKGHGHCGAPISIAKRSQFPLPNPIAGLIGTDS